MNIIKLNGKEFPSVVVSLPFGERKISNIKLNESLINSEGAYVSEEARLIDENIFYFVEDEVLHLRKNTLTKIILSQS